VSLLLQSSTTTHACSDGLLMTRLGKKGAMLHGDGWHSVGSVREVAKWHGGDIEASWHLSSIFNKTGCVRHLFIGIQLLISCEG
jgi:hypothetical protein